MSASDDNSLHKIHVGLSPATTLHIDWTSNLIPSKTEPITAPLSVHCRNDTDNHLTPSTTSVSA